MKHVRLSCAIVVACVLAQIPQPAVAQLTGSESGHSYQSRMDACIKAKRSAEHFMGSARELQEIKGNKVVKEHINACSCEQTDKQADGDLLDSWSCIVHWGIHVEYQ